MNFLSLLIYLNIEKNRKKQYLRDFMIENF